MVVAEEGSGSEEVLDEGEGECADTNLMNSTKTTGYTAEIHVLILPWSLHETMSPRRNYTNIQSP